MAVGLVLAAGRLALGGASRALASRGAATAATRASTVIPKAVSRPTAGAAIRSNAKAGASKVGRGIKTGAKEGGKFYLYSEAANALSGNGGNANSQSAVSQQMSGVNWYTGT